MRTRRHSSVQLDTKKKSHIGPVHLADWHTSFWVILEQDGPIGMGDWMAKAGDWAVWVEDGATTEEEQWRQGAEQWEAFQLYYDMAVTP